MIIPEILLSYGKAITFKKGSHIFHDGKPLTHCYYIQSGLVKVYVDHYNGKRSVLDFFGKGTWLGELSLFTHEERVKENGVIQTVEALEFSITELSQLCKEDVEVSFFFANYMANTIIKRSYRLSEYMSYPLESRLARFILDYSNDDIYDISHVDAAEYLNVSYRHLLYTIKEFCDNNILTKDNKYIITNKKALLHLAIE